MTFKPLVIWIWNQNIAISTIVGTFVPYNTPYTKCLHDYKYFKKRNNQKPSIKVISANFQLYHSTINQRTDNAIGQKKKNKRRKMVNKALHRKLKIEQHEPLKTEGESPCTVC